MPYVRGLPEGLGDFPWITTTSAATPFLRAEDVPGVFCAPLATTYSDIFATMLTPPPESPDTSWETSMDRKD